MIKLEYNGRRLNGMVIGRIDNQYDLRFPVTVLPWLNKYEGLQRFRRARLAAFIYQAGWNTGGYCSSDSMLGTVGKDYKTIVGEMVSAGFIVINEHYSNYSDNRFCKRYNFTKTHLDAEVYSEKYIVQKMVESVETVAERDVLEETVAHRHSLRSERNLSVDMEALSKEELPTEKVYSAYDAANRINNKDYHPKTPEKSKRQYNASVMAPNVVKKHFKWDNGDVVVNVDIKSAWPTFLGIVAEKEGVDVTAYKDLVLRYDIYGQIQSHIGVDREDAKRIFNSFINSSIKERKSKVWRPMHTFFKNIESEELLNWILEQDTIWEKLEYIETGLMNTLGAYAFKNNIRWVRQHDGFLTDTAHVDDLVNELHKISVEFTGIQLEVKISSCFADPADRNVGIRRIHMSSYSNQQVTEETTIESMMLPQLQNRLEKLQSDLANINLQRRKLGYSLSSKKLQRGYSDTQDKLKRTAVLKQSILDAISRTTLLIHAYENNQIVLTKTER
jgi:hypothetical protein